MVKKFAVFQTNVNKRAQRKFEKETSLLKLRQKIEGYVSVLKACL
jgi:hypothetical protein